MAIDTLPAHGPPPLAAAQLYGVRRRPRRTRTRVRPLAPAPSVSRGAGGTSCPTTLTRPSQLSRTILERSQRAGSDRQFEPGTRGEDTGGSTADRFLSAPVQALSKRRVSQHVFVQSSPCLSTAGMQLS